MKRFQLLREIADMLLGDFCAGLCIHRLRLHAISNSISKSSRKQVAMYPFLCSLLRTQRTKQRSAIDDETARQTRRQSGAYQQDAQNTYLHCWILRVHARIWLVRRWLLRYGRHGAGGG